MAAAIDAWMGQRIPIRVTTELDTITEVLAPKTRCTNCQVLINWCTVFASLLRVSC